LATTKHVLRRNRNGVCHQKKQQSLHTQDILKNIGITRPSSARVLSPPPAEKHRKRNDFDPRASHDSTAKPLTETEVDILADITNGNSGIVCLLRRVSSESSSHCNIDVLARFETVETSEHIELPMSLNNVSMDKIGSFDEFLEIISINEQEINLIQESTSEQAGSELWFEYRTNRITASKFKDSVQKINDNMTVKNPDKSRTFISKVCGYYPRFESKATQWGITNEPIARKIIQQKINLNTKL